MNEMQNKFNKLLNENQVIRELILEKETFEEAYAAAEEALSGLTVEEFRDWAKTTFSKEQMLTDEQMADAAGGVVNPRQLHKWIQYL